ncbi:cell division protein ZapA [Lacticaseibacillus zhaodongensis]|uniref:cell division protein ZapA n=1 Tax=Lacticaseibacillus zhaodongensis TaxID=2668065 RepID=UPI0012D2D167|nr:cell division protein ZapA [Lacticaseibacillus zhaodongensis]
MTEEKRRYKANIGGKNYTLIGRGSTAKFAAATQIVNDQLDQIKRLAPKISTEDAAVLLAFNAIAEQVGAEAQRAETSTES